MGTRTTLSDIANCFACQNREHTEWCVLSGHELDQLSGRKICRQYHPGQEIFREGDEAAGIYCLESGLVGYRKADVDGNSTLLGLAYPGRTLGYRSYLSGEPHATSGEALKPSRVCFIDRATVRDLLEKNPALGFMFLQTVSKELGVVEEKYHQAITLTVRDRLIHLLLVLRDRYATTGQDGAEHLELPLSRQDIAALIGTRPETLARTIRRIEDDGLARFSGRILHVPKVHSLFDEIGLGHY